MRRSADFSEGRGRPNEHGKGPFSSRGTESGPPQRDRLVVPEGAGSARPGKEPVVVFGEDRVIPPPDVEFSARESTSPAQMCVREMAQTGPGRDHQLLSNILPPGSVDAEGKPIKGVPVTLSTGQKILISPNVIF